MRRRRVQESQYNAISPENAVVKWTTGVGGTEPVSVLISLANLIRTIESRSQFLTLPVTATAKKKEVEAVGRTD